MPQEVDGRPAELALGRPHNEAVLVEAFKKDPWVGQVDEKEGEVLQTESIRRWKACAAL